MRRFTRVLLALLAALVAGVSGLAPIGVPSAGAADETGGDLDVFTVGAPVDPTGRTPSARTDFLVGFAEFDPSVPGISLKEGGTISVTLPPEFRNTTGAPVGPVGGPPGCAPPVVTGCSTGVIVQGWPQSPVPPLPGVSHDPATNTFVFTAKADWSAGGFDAPGPKAVHLIALGFRNPSELGDYPIHVAIKPDPASATTLRGSGIVTIDHTKPAITPNGQANPGPVPLANTLYQRVVAGETSNTMGVYLWDRSARPIVGARVNMTSASSGTIVDAGGRAIGQVTIEAPDGAAGYSLATGGPSEEISAFVSGIPVGRMTAEFRTAPKVAGEYTVTFAIDGADALVHRITASVPPPAVTPIRGGRVSASFVRLAGDTADPSGSTMAADCGGDLYENASATLRITTRNNASTVQILMRNARPNTLYTTWLRLKGTTADGVSFGGSPLTGAGSTPLAPTTQLGELLASTGAGNGTTAVANGLRTNNQGNGQLNIALDFPIIDGAYPFDRFEGFDPSDARFALDSPAAVPTAIVIPNESTSAPFGLRMVSHCTDDLGHGFDAGVRQPWFDWPR